MQATTGQADWHYGGGGGGGNETSIQDGIDAASDGDTVYVYAGTYNEVVVVDKQISLIGEDSDTTIIDAGGTGSVIEITSKIFW